MFSRPESWVGSSRNLMWKYINSSTACIYIASIVYFLIHFAWCFRHYLLLRHLHFGNLVIPVLKTRVTLVKCTTWLELHMHVFKLSLSCDRQWQRYLSFLSINLCNNQLCCISVPVITVFRYLPLRIIRIKPWL